MFSINKYFIKMSFYIAVTFIGTIVGSGFTSGQEVLQFFGTHGILGFWGIAVSFVMFVFWGYIILLFGCKKGWESYNELFCALFGKKVSLIFDTVFTIFLFGLSSVMLAGSGAILKEYMSLPIFLGSLFTLLVTILIVKKGITGIASANGFIVPLLIFFILCVSYITIDFTNFHPTPLIIKETLLHSWFLSACFYVSYNMGIALGVILPMGKIINHKKILFGGVFIGGIVLCLLLFAIDWSLMSMPAQYLFVEIPLLMTVKKYHILGFAFSFILWAETFTTLVGTSFAFFSRINKLVPKKFNFLFWSLIFLFGQIGFSKLIWYLYPFFGMICSFIFIGITFKIFTGYLAK